MPVGLDGSDRGTLQTRKTSANSSVDHYIPPTKNTKSEFEYVPAKNSNQAVWNISFLNLRQRESHSCNTEIFHVAYYNVITPDLAFVMTGFLPIGEYCASGLYSAGKTGSRGTVPLRISSA